MKKRRNKVSVALSILLLLASAVCTAQNVGIGTTEPLARLHVVDSAVVFSRANTTLEPFTDPPIQGPGIRMMWYPGKAAFRAGGATTNQWDKDSIGVYSIALGYSPKAVGAVTFSAGFNTIARGDFSTSMGNATSARGNNSTSMGSLTRAIGNSSTSMGSETTALGDFSASIGIGTIAKGRGTIAAGSWNDDTDNPFSATTNPTDRIFQIGNGSSNSVRSNAVTVLRNGNTGIGVLNPGFILDVNGRIRLRSSNSLSAGINLNNDANSDIAAFMGMRSTDNEVGFYGYTGTAGWRLLVNTTTGDAWMQGTLTQNSDFRLKKDIKPLTHTLAAIQQLKGYSYHWKDPNNPDEQIGLLAQELQKVYPQLVKENDRGDLSVNYSGMVPVLLEAIKELQQRVAQLEEKLK